MPAFERRFGLTSSTATSLSSHIVSLFQAGCFFGALFVGVINARFGRKWSLIIAGLVFIVGAIIQVACDGNLGAMYAGRVLTGLGVGSSSLVVTNYIAECSTPSTRGSLVGGFEMYLQVGLVVGESALSVASTSQQCSAMLTSCVNRPQPLAPRPVLQVSGFRTP